MVSLSLANAKNPPVIHLVTEHLPPYQIEDKNSKLSGFAVEVIKETMKRSQYDYTMNSYSWLRSYKLAQVKANHCIFSIVRTKSREDIFKWVGPVSYVNNTAIWALKGREIHLSNLNDAKKYTTAVSRDDLTHIALQERGFINEEHLYVLDNTRSLVNLLMTRPEIDLIAANDMTIKFYVELAGATLDDLQRVYEMKDLPLNFFFACSKKTNDKIISNLAENLQSLYQDGSYDVILKRWRNQLISPTL